MCGGVRQADGDGGFGNGIQWVGMAVPRFSSWLPILKRHITPRNLPLLSFFTCTCPMAIFAQSPTGAHVPWSLLIVLQNKTSTPIGAVSIGCHSISASSPHHRLHQLQRSLEQD